MPFRVLSSEKGDEYLSLGFADALITTRKVVVRQTEAVTKYAGVGPPHSVHAPAHGVLFISNRNQLYALADMRKTGPSVSAK